MLSVRRNRRGRRVSAPDREMLSVVVVDSVFVIRLFSAEIVRAAAFRRAELPSETCAMRAVGTEVPPAHRAGLEPGLFLRLPACPAEPIQAFAHGRARALEISCLI